MTVIYLEALAVLVLLVLIVWWTMFSGRKKGELPGQHDERPDDAGSTTKNSTENTAGTSTETARRDARD